jgi:tripartite-type tricarboxylate transporter receptor subunit TctC
MSYASFGTGTSSHIYGEAFARQAGLDVVHVPYKGGADAAKDFLAGRVQYYFDAAPNAIQNTATGKVRMLAVAAPRRSPMLPDVPTMTEQGVSGVDMASWLGFYGPARMPAPVVAKLNAALWRRCWRCRPRATSSARAPTKPNRRPRSSWPS